MSIKVTKYMHSCLLVEADGLVALFDPGNFSYESGLFDLNKIDVVDRIIITHEHADHFHLPFVEMVVAKFPDLKITAPQSVIDQLEHLQVGALRCESSTCTKIIKSDHEPLPFGWPQPDNIGVHFQDAITHPGDSHNFTETKRVLAMPMTAPWGSFTSAVAKVLELKPEVVIPIHDYHYRPEVLAGLYQRFEQAFAEKGIKFIIPVNGQVFEV